jgi:hypothetical protein
MACIYRYGSELAGYTAKRFTRRKSMQIHTDLFDAWPDDPAWPDPYGNDPYDITKY